MYNSATVAETIKALAKKRNVSIKKVLEDVGLNYNMMTTMRTSMPKADNLAKIADYLDCSVDYLLGKTNDPSSTASSITEDEQALLAAYRTLDADGKIKAEEYLSALAKLHGLTMQITNGLYVLSDPDAEITDDDIKELTED